MKNNRWAILIAWLATMLVAVVYLGNKLQVTSDISQFMPDYNVADDRIALFLDELKEGQTSKLLFIRLKAETARQSAYLSKSLKQTLLQSELFETVANGQLDYDIADLQSLFKYRYLMNPNITRNSFLSDNIKHSLNERLLEIRAGMGMLIKQNIGADPTNAFIDYLRYAKRWGDPVLQHGVWFANDITSALLIAQMSQKNFDLDSQQRAIDFVNQTIQHLAKGTTVSIDISGPGAFAVATRAKIQRALMNLSVVGGGLILVILFLSYRSLLLVVLVGIPLISAALIAISITNAVFGNIHGITLAFGITLLGVCLDYPVHLFSHLREKQNAALTLESIWPTLRLGVLTTSLGYLALLWSGISGLSQLAVFAVVGLAVALSVTRWVIPEWIPVNNRPDINPKSLARFLEYRWLSRYGVVLVVVISGTAISSLLWKGKDIWETDISALSPIPKKLGLLDRELRKELGVPDINHMFMLTNENPETLLQETERLAASLQPLLDKGLVQQIFSATNLLPSQVSQKTRQSQLPNKAELETAVSAAMQDLPFKEDLFNKFINDVDASRTLPSLTWKDMQATPLAGIIKSDFFQTRDQWISIIRLSGILDEDSFKGWLEQHPKMLQTYINLHQTASESVNLFRMNAIIGLILGCFVMCMFLLIFTKSISVSTRVLLPPVLAVAVSLGLQVWFGEQLNLFHILSVLLIIGIGIDYSLFFNRSASDARDRQQNMHGVVVSASSTFAAFGILAVSEIPVMAAIGLTIAIGVLACFIFSLFLAKKQNNQNQVLTSTTLII